MGIRKCMQARNQFSPLNSYFLTAKVLPVLPSVAFIDRGKVISATKLQSKSSKKPVKGWASICMQTAKGFWRLKLTLKEHLPINWPSFKTADPRSLATSCLSALCYSNRHFNNLSTLIIWKNTWVSIRVTGHLRLNRQSHCLKVPNGPLMSHQDLESIFDSRTLLKAFTPRNYWHSQQTSAKFS